MPLTKEEAALYAELKAKDVANTKIGKTTPEPGAGRTEADVNVMRRPVPGKKMGWGSYSDIGPDETPAEAKGTVKRIVRPKRTGTIQETANKKRAKATVIKRRVGRPALSEEEKAAREVARREAKGLPPKRDKPGRPSKNETLEDEGYKIQYVDDTSPYDESGQTKERLHRYLINPEHSGKRKVGRVVNYTADEIEKGLKTTGRTVANLTRLGPLPEYNPPDFSFQALHYQPLIYDPVDDPYFTRSPYAPLKYKPLPYDPKKHPYFTKTPYKPMEYKSPYEAPPEYKSLEWETVINKPGNEYLRGEGGNPYLMGQSESQEQWNPMRWVGGGEGEDKNMVLDYEPHQYEATPYKNIEYQGIMDKLFGQVKEIPYNKNLLGSTGYISELDKASSGQDVLKKSFGDLSKIPPIMPIMPEPVVQPKVQRGTMAAPRPILPPIAAKSEKETGVSLF